MHKLFLLSILCSFSLMGQNTCFTIFSFNDTYGVFQEKKLSHLAKIMTLLEEERKTAEDAITLMNGELSFTERADFFVLDIINRMKVDYVCAGYKMFKEDFLKSGEQKTDFYWLAANCIGKDHLPFAESKQMHVFTIEGIKIGLFGLIKDSEDDNFEEMKCISPLFVAKEKVLELKKQGVDVIVVVTQLDAMQDRALAKSIPEIDVIIGCQEKEPISWFEGQTFIHQTSLNEPHITRIDIHIEKKKTPWRTQIQVLPTWRLILDDEIQPHPAIAELVEKIS